MRGSRSTRSSPTTSGTSITVGSLTRSAPSSNQSPGRRTARTWRRNRRRLLRRVAELLRPGVDHLLLGTDLVKDPDVLEAAYDDGEGVTAEFNRNVLRVINRELDADFDVDSFEHVALFDAEREWIEMRLRALRTATVTIPALGLEVSFAAGEEVRTEISAKFTRERLEGDYEAAGLLLTNWWTDSQGLFALSLAASR